VLHAVLPDRPGGCCESQTLQRKFDSNVKLNRGAPVWV
jgi:hypothetical protein